MGKEPSHIVYYCRFRSWPIENLGDDRSEIWLGGGEVKLVLAIVPADDAGGITDVLSHKEIGVTRINTVGGFLRKGNATLLIGVEDDRVGEAIDIVDSKARAGRRFVFNVERYERV